MESLFCTTYRRALGSCSTWPVGLGLAVLILFAVFCGQVAQASASPVSMTEAESVERDVTLSNIADPYYASVGGIQAGASPASSSAISHTIYLPVVFGRPEVADPLPFGVQVNHINSETTVRAADSGASWVRMRLYWDAIEPSNTSPEYYRWSPGLDQELASYAANGVGVVLTLMGNPDWAATYSAGPIDKVDISELVQFMQAVVGRYGAPPYNVKHWEMYNEPDNTSEWRAADGGHGYFGDNPEAYVAVLEAVYQPMKEVDPGAQVVFGGMAYDGWESGFSESFLDDVLSVMLDRGFFAFDLMNFHYYPLFALKWEGYGLGIDIIAKTNYIRNKLAYYGAHKPLICTETSMWSDEEHGGSDELQSRYVPQVHARSQAAGLEFSIWYMLYDVDEPWAWDYGLLDANLLPKPSHQAYLTLGRQLALADYSRTLTSNETGSDQIEAYEFLERDGTHRIVVVWSNDGLTHPMTLPGASLVKVGKYGDEATIYDGDDGSVDGKVVVTIGPSPVYLRLSQ